ncbi:MAG TPA: putative glycolipid-binding domain-containing protein [Geothrix sp.]|nr:putative glycolipid-binding domain-containing protein [Geothrix sp.]
MLLGATPPAPGKTGGNVLDATSFVRKLLASGPAAKEGANRDLYGMLVGDWDAAVVDRTDSGAVYQSAEIHATWALRGRAIQDLWIVPAVHDREADSPGQAGRPVRYGTTIRVYDPGKDRWNITWFNPVTGAENHLEGRREGGEIMQTGFGPGGIPMRWVFDHVLPDAFHWRGERFVEDSKTWACDTEFLALRAAPPQAPEAGPAVRTATWGWTDRLGLERMSLAAEGDRRVARGRIAVMQDQAPLQVTYRITHASDHRFLEAWIQAQSAQGTREITLRRGADGQWEVGGQPRPDLAGCEDVDLMLSPYTNTPPLLARALAPGERRALQVVWVRFPDLEAHPVDQAYTRLPGATPSRYRYENLGSGFKGELTLDDAGLVLEYGPWRRR